VAGTSGIQCPPNVRIVRLMCSGAVDRRLLGRSWRVPTVCSSAAVTPAIVTTRTVPTRRSDGRDTLKEILKSMGMDEDRAWLRWVTASEVEISKRG